MIGPGLPALILGNLTRSQEPGGTRRLLLAGLALWVAGTALALAAPFLALWALVVVL
jgi:hypothetical protein